MALTTNLSPELLRSFVAVVENGSMSKAASRVFLSQSALSLQIRRLEEVIQRPLFRRNGTRNLAITSAGKELLAYAHEILALNDRAIAALKHDHAQVLRLGTVQAFADSLLPPVLRAFSTRHPGLRLDILVAGSNELDLALRDHELDIALGLSFQQNAGSLGRAPACWIGLASLAEQRPIPLVLLPEPCIFRTAALQVLERARLGYDMAVEASNLASLQTAVRSGLGITCRPRPLPGDQYIEMIETTSLPTLPDVRYVLNHNVGRDTPAAELVQMLRSAFPN
jgi:DNA-binding transcriptional LysR family regulator